MKVALVLLVVTSSLIETTEGSLTWRVKLLRDLMSNYDRSVMPANQSDTQLTASMWFGLSRMESLDEIAQVMTTFGQISMVWTDEVLQWDPAEYGGLDRLVVNSDQVWIPEVAMLNSVDGGSDLGLTTQSRVSITYNGTVNWAPGMKWRTSCKVYPRNFPFDTQICEVQFISLMYGGHILNLTNSQSEVDVSCYISNGQWELISQRVGRHDTNDSATVSMPIVAFQLRLMRQSPYYILNLLVPALILNIITLLSFSLPVESGDRISMDITILLTYFVLLLMMSDITPKSSETIPLLSMYIVAEMCVSAMATCCTVLILSIHYHSADKRAPSFLRSCVLQGLATCLFMGSTIPDSTNKVEPISKKHNDGENTTVLKATAGLAVSDEALEYFKEQRASNEIKQVEDDIRAEWEALACVLDRLFLLVHTVLSVILTAVFMGMAASDSVDSNTDTSQFYVTQEL